jgi:hypothetical protein
MQLFFIMLSALVIVGLLLLVIFLFIILKSKHDDVEAPWPYRCKRYFFSRSEQEFLRSLNASINHQKFVVFPKVRLADFIEVTVSGNEYQSWWNKIRSKHIDYLIWDTELAKIVLAIELDGKSHETEKMHARDEFVGRLYDTVGIKLERVKVGENFENRAQEISRNL